MPPAVLYKRFDSRERLWIEGDMELSLDIKAKVESVLERRGEFPVALLQIVDVEPDEVEEFNGQSPIAGDMLAVEEQ